MKETLDLRNVQILENRLDSIFLLTAAASDEIVIGERLTAEEAGYLEELISKLDLNPEEETLLRKAIFGEADRDQPAGLPASFSLGQNFPNPFNPATTISFEVPLGSRETVSLKVYDLRGRLVRVLADAEKPAGSYTVFWDGKDESGRPAASGMYLCRMKAESFSQNRKMVLLR